MRTSFKAALALLVMTGAGNAAAQAAPAFTNPTFASTSTTTTFAYSAPISGWTNVSGSGSAIGISAAVPSALWDNGVAPNSENNVAFLQNKTSGLQQAVGGFVVGDRYEIAVVADARAATGPTELGIEVNGIEYGGYRNVGAVDLYGVYATAWATYYSAIFTVTSALNLIQLENLGVTGSTNFNDVTIDLGNAAILDVTPTTVPEPASLALLAAGLLGASVVRRRTTQRRALPR